MSDFASANIAQDDQNVFVELRDWTTGEMLDQVVEAALPAQRAGDDLGGKCAITIVGEPHPRLQQRCRKIDAAADNRLQPVKCRRPRRCDHRACSPDPPGGTVEANLIPGWSG